MKDINEKDRNIHISVVIPVYRSESCLNILYERLTKSLNKITNDYEVILVNDGSPLNDWNVIKSIAKKDNRIAGVNLSRNFGQHHAVTAGLDYSKGEWVVVMDCDLQEPPEEIIKLYNKAQEGYDVVYGRRTNRKDPFYKLLSSKIFFSVFSYLTDMKQDGAVSNFGIYSRKAIDSVNQLRENLRFFPTMIKWVGFSSACVDIEHSTSANSSSSYTLKKMMRLAIDVIIAFSDKPLRLTVQFGLFVSVSAAFYAVLVVIRSLKGSIELEGWASLIASIWLFSGLVIFILGIIGIYITRIFDEVKNRPIYIIKEVYELKR